MPATLTPLRYPGGKTKYAHIFQDIISLNNLDGCTFVEVFAGGAGAAVSLLLKGKVKSLLLNDLDAAIYCFWRSVKERPEELIGLIRDTPVNVIEWGRQKTIYDNKDPSDVLALGFSTFFLNRCNHAGILGARPIGGMSQEGSYTITSRYNKTTSIEKIKRIAEFAGSIEIHNLDGVAFLQLLETRYHTKKCLVYLDPPYYQKGPELYLNHFDHEDHELLRDTLLGCPFPWVLSYDSHKEIVDLYGNWDCNLYRNRLRHTIVGNTTAEELIISRLSLPDYLEQL